MRLPRNRSRTMPEQQRWDQHSDAMLREFARRAAAASIPQMPLMIGIPKIPLSERVRGDGRDGRVKVIEKPSGDHAWCVDAHRTLWVRSDGSRAVPVTRYYTKHLSPRERKAPETGSRPRGWPYTAEWRSARAGAPRRGNGCLSGTSLAEALAQFLDNGRTLFCRCPPQDLRSTR